MMDMILSSSGNKDDVSGEAAISIFQTEVYDAQNMDVVFSQPFPAVRKCYTYDDNDMINRRRGLPVFEPRCRPTVLHLHKVLSR
jgi:hypothetical protein